VKLPSPAELTDRLVPLLDVLADHFGPQRWWTDTDPFEVIAGALLATAFFAWLHRGGDAK